MRKFFTLLIAIITLSFSSQAQNGTGKVTGQVIDGNTKTIESATISLLRAKDSSVAKISVATKDGKYQFEDVAAGKYMVSISDVGHSKGYSETFEITSANSIIMLKSLELVPLAKDL